MSFDTLAPHYRWLECVSAGNKLQRCRTAFLDRITASTNVLLLGEGNGRFLVECRQRVPEARVTCVDASARMLELARRRMRSRALDPSPVRFVHADVTHWVPDERYDGIVTHFFLDCFRAEQLEVLVARLAKAAAGNARWLLADFRTPPNGPGRWRASLILSCLYFFFRLATGLSARALTPPDALLEGGGFRLRERKVCEWGLLHTDCWERLPTHSSLAQPASGRPEVGIR